VMRFVTEQVVIQPKMEDQAQTASISKRPLNSQIIAANESTAKVTGRRNVDIAASRVARFLVRSSWEMNSVRTSGIDWSTLEGSALAEI